MFSICFVCIKEVLKIYLVTSVPGVAGSWSDEGCTVLKSQEYQGFTTCTCTHLTNFALLLDISQTRHMSQGLSVITWIGCGISIAGLALTIITYLRLKYVCFRHMYWNSVFNIVWCIKFTCLLRSACCIPFQITLASLSLSPLRNHIIIKLVSVK